MLNDLKFASGEVIGVGNGGTQTVTLANTNKIQNWGFTLYFNGVKQTSGYKFSPSNGTVTFRAASNVIVTADYYYNWDEENFRPMTSSGTYVDYKNPSRATTQFTYYGLDSNTSGNAAIIRMTMKRGTGGVANESLGTSTGSVQGFKLPHHAIENSIVVSPTSAAWNWNDNLDVLTVTASAGQNISVAYNGLIGQNDNYLSAASGSFSNWIDYNYYLNNSPSVPDDAETRSLMNIAAQNSLINSGLMEARYEHKLPITLQILFNHQLSKHLSIETGLSYTRLASTISTGSINAYVQEQQRLHYLGVPFRLSWQWYSMAHLSLYSSAGMMLELPIKSAVDISHISNGINTFQKEASLDAPIQWSTNLGLGLQYDFTPHFGLYLEPSLQYFFDDGSDLKTYRTEHPLQITLPFGIRFRW